MIDAMGGPPSSASQIQDGGADYLLALKANEKETHQVVAAHFESLRPTQAAQAAGPSSRRAGLGVWVQSEHPREQNQLRYEQREVIV